MVVCVCIYVPVFSLYPGLYAAIAIASSYALCMQRLKCQCMFLKNEMSMHVF